MTAKEFGAQFLGEMKRAYPDLASVAMLCIMVGGGGAAGHYFGLLGIVVAGITSALLAVPTERFLRFILPKVSW